MEQRAKKITLNTIVENFITLMIFLSLIQVFLCDFLIYIDLLPNILKIVRLSSFIFDFVFFLEFIVRLLSNISQKKGCEYFFFDNGWVDFISSLPLLLFVSCPFFVKEIFGFDIASTKFCVSIGYTTIINAERLMSLLQLLRILKIFNRIYIGSRTSRRHTASILITVILSVLIFCGTIFLLQDINFLPSIKAEMVKQEEVVSSFFARQYKMVGSNQFVMTIKKTAELYNNVVLVNYKNNVEYSVPHMNSQKIEQKLKCNDKTFVKSKVLDGKLQIVFSRIDYFKTEALINMVLFIFILFLSINVILFYTNHFIKTVLAPVINMRRGFEELMYITPVKILKFYKNDDIFIMANAFNTRWLPAKMRKLQELKQRQEKLSERGQQ